MLPVGKSICTLDEDDMCDLDDFESSSSNIDLFEGEETSSFDLFDGLLERETDTKEIKPKNSNDKKRSVVRVYPNGDTQEKQLNFASIRTLEEKELIDYLGNGNRGRLISRSSNVTCKNSRRSNTTNGKRSSSNDSVKSSSPVGLESRDGACMTKSAVAARENRKKKKKYTEELETTVDILKTENTGLKTRNNMLQTSLDQLKTEVQYLKSVIANQTTLAHLIGNIQNTPGVKFQTSLTVDRYDKENIKDINENTVDKSVSVPVATKKRKVEDAHVPTMQMNTRYGKLKRGTSTTSKEIKPEKMDDQCDSSPSSTLEQNSNEMPGHGPAGICLHVSNGSVSLEFCANCASSAAHAKAITCDHSYGKVQGEG
ncbi:uncharacterized protein LOC110455541 [Mizuhopecten yessoensis]|uniref:CREB/ATF bZIP transcription factor n=1 Tax=Mizuhopecten yessoensis TaxID=6573 RepID=A0A210QCW0_MIZYE|nr:uncharacterized protein LOC110455541 [Mizuhopecten yessoensis]XP_021361403.1 uncharacterized protein LOC110455541 [Mizuhopecten yessoensis]XP_021361404.1 uncharacterized protein LOC110455541 [Mizuhopecten yessoensis]OWF46593.1 CREB/ATF bZIP transcription factor [Mizuhopecten yessoensis]